MPFFGNPCQNFLFSLRTQEFVFLAGDQSTRSRDFGRSLFYRSLNSLSRQALSTTTVDLGTIFRATQPFSELKIVIVFLASFLAGNRPILKNSCV
jgi:hypothetical protein